MQQAKNITVHLFNAAGLTLGWLSVPATLRLTDLDHLRALGAARLEVRP